MPNKKINQLDSRVGVSLTDLSLVGDPVSGTSFKLTLNDVSTVMGVPGKFNQPTGTAAQYIRGDGQLATFPSFAGGGSSVNYYLNGSVNASVGGYKQMDNSAIVGGGTDFTLVGNGLIAQFLTNVGNPNRIQIPGGAWNFEMFFQVSSSGGNQKFYVELHKYDGATFTLIASSSTVPEEITGGTSIDLYLTSLAVPTTALLATDRLAIRVYIVDNAVGRTVTLHTENNTLCEIITTFAGGVASLNGLTANTQYLATGTSGTDFNISSLTDTHTFNLPTASATNRGALSTADWSTFNGKIGGTGVNGQVSYWSGTNTQAGNNNLFWDNTNARLGVGTNTPQGNIQISENKNGITNLQISNTTAGTTSQSGLRLDSDASSGTMNIGKYSSTSNSYLSISPTDGYLSNANFGDIVLQNEVVTGKIKFAAGAASTAQMTLHATGNLSIGATTDTTQRLQVTGNTLLKGSGNTSATTALTVQNSDGANLFRVNNSGFYFLSGTNGMFLSMFTTSGGTASINGSNTQFYNYTTTQAATSGAFLFTGESFQQTSGLVHTILINKHFTPTSGNASFSNLTIQPGNINQTGGANGITRGLYVNPTLTAAADWRSIETSNNSGWAFYGAGTAQSQFGGAVTIAGGLTLSSGSLSLPVAIHSIFASAYRIWNRASNRWTFEALNANIGFEFKHIMTSGNAFNIVNSTDVSQFLVSGAGNTILGSTSDTTEKLQVNGTMKVTGASTFGGNMTLDLAQNGVTQLIVRNLTNATSVQASMSSVTSSGAMTLAKLSALTTTYKILSANDGFIYNSTLSGDIAILNDFASGSIKMAAGGSSTAHMTIKSNGRINMSSLPTSATGLVAGDLWNDAGTLKIV